jgi:hypothetical protein
MKIITYPINPTPKESLRQTIRRQRRAARSVRRAGEVRFFITFRQASPLHDRYCIVTAASRTDAHQAAKGRFANDWSMLYSESEWWLTPTETQAERYGLCELK